MERVICPKGVWVPINLTASVGVKFIITRDYPDDGNIDAYAIYANPTITPDDNTTDYAVYQFGDVEYYKGINFSFDTADKVWVKSLYKDGAYFKASFVP